jgi:hypothetical protein
MENLKLLHCVIQLKFPSDCRRYASKRPSTPMRTTFLAIIFLIVIPVWGAELSPLEKASGVLAEVTGKSVRNFSTQDFGRTMYTKARSVLVSEQIAEVVLRDVRARLPAGTIAFVGVTHSLARTRPNGVELVVAEGNSQFDILRVAASDGINYGLKTEDLIHELQTWDREIGIDIWQAETDTVQLRLKSIPKNLSQFAIRVYKFCPDIVEQGVGSISALEKEIAKEKSVFLWWD